MKNFFRYSIFFLFATLVFTSCTNFRRLITDEIVLKDGNSQTGTIIRCDSTNLKIKKSDESISIIPWKLVDTIQGKKLKTLWVGMNFGPYSVPYFSVFRNESFSANHAGIQFKIGTARRGVHLYYLHLTIIPAQPYTVTKIGVGFQQYLGSSTYLKKNTFFVGSEVNLMSVKYNNGPQIVFDPYTGFEKKLTDQLRIHLKLGIQLNLANKNNGIGASFTVGIHFMNRNFKEYYNTLNKEHYLPGK